MNSNKEILETLKRGVEEIIPEKEFKTILESKKKLIIKAGFDPTSSDLHLGHTVLINKLKQFQDLGHKIIFLIGDFTGLIGDPSGVNETRPTVSKSELKKNAKSYSEQVFKILDPKKTKIEYNSSWFDKMKPSEIIELASAMTVARMLERDDFSKRFKGNRPISIHEFLYPLVQGYDSFALKADIELGGTDQKFNLLVGRDIQKLNNMKEQIVITMPILEGLDGIKKMSKSLNNYIGLKEKPETMFGKIMSISDELMWKYFDLLSFKSNKEINSYKASVKKGANPMEFKIILGEEIVERFHTKKAAEDAREEFKNRFRKKKAPSKIKKVKIKIPSKEILLIDLLAEPKLKKDILCSSKSEARRMIKQSAVKVDNNKINNEQFLIKNGSKHTFQVGKHRHLIIDLA
ncbi:tyrosine--tRNA ligase [Gammaproteobacteria bacterium]|jgi:tyrosyl-tRNA synthetase|nr:tyrosine--tRNA ligase [Gammaproteobacteria bacterium]RZP00189.1 MAG: tyrosine--tRNA ligase [Gammaproteobacteria bacterium]|tara:strand:+ start:15231 stop:16445 length:1215 start_codon:yes stop_codon:yes gene_type:complete